VKLPTPDIDELIAIDSGIQRSDLEDLDFEVRPAPLKFFGITKAGAVTWPLSSRVYVNNTGGMWDRRGRASRLAVLAHESVHVGQRRRLGRVRFLLRYLGFRILTIGRPASKHPMEREGYRIQQKVRDALRASND
jgi:hypothetical protein